MPDYPMTDVIAEREYDFVDDGAHEVIRIRLGKPAVRPEMSYQTWYCPCVLERGGKTESLCVSGEDSVQALLLGLSYLRSSLQQIAAKGRLTFAEGIEGPYMDLTG